MTVDIDTLALEQQVCFALAVTNRAVLSIYRPLLEPLGLTHPQYLVMLALWDHQKESTDDDAPLSVKQIAATLQLDSATLSPILKRLQTLGLIARTEASQTNAPPISSSPTTAAPCVSAHLRYQPPSWLDSAST